MTQDLFMGIAAALTGIFVLISAIRNTEAFQGFWLTARIESRFGSNAAQVAGALSGLALMATGILLMLGVLPVRSRQASLFAGPERTSLGLQTGLMRLPLATSVTTGLGW